MQAFSIILATVALLGWTYLAVAHGQFWRPKFGEPAPEPDAWPSVDIIVPARDEADVIPQALPTLLDQDYPGAWRVILVDDGSTDGTGEVARRIAGNMNKTGSLAIVAAPPKPDDWGGKVAAMQAGVAQSVADYVLFTDADIAHVPASLRTLVARSIEYKVDLNSLMVRLRCESLAEKLLIPAFVFFFAMLYPFRQAADPQSGVAAAAGGAMLVRRQALNNCGGLAAIKSALIDDCSLARVIKRAGGELAAAGSIDLNLARDVRSLRAYPGFGDVTRMVARTAFTQLGFSTGMLIGTIFGMGILFLVPPLLPVISSLWPSLIGFVAWMIMSVIYLPMVLYYRLPWFWAVTLPVAAVIYLAATCDSALQYWRGAGGQWKGRIAAEG